jgi:hypothetical protein
MSKQQEKVVERKSYLCRSFKGRKRPRLDKLDTKQEKQDGDDKVKLEDTTKMDTKGNGSCEQLDA